MLKNCVGRLGLIGRVKERATRHASSIALGLVALAGLLGAAGVASAQGTIIISDPTAPINSGETSIGQTSDGTTAINIATPGTDGTSLNSFADFNVDANGVVISNNAGNVQSSQGAGTVYGNANLVAGSEAATVILSVTGVNQSVIEGWLEIAGQDADLIIANQNGLTCNGCAFYNVNELTLAAASAEVLANGQVAVTTKGGSRLVIGRDGLNASGATATTLVGSQVSIDGALDGGQSLTIIGGEDTTVNLATGEITGGGVNTGVYAVDATEFGAMTAGQITIIGTDQGLGVRSAGTISATGQESFEEDESGNFIGDGNGSITITSAGDIELQSAEAFGSDLTIDAAGDATLIGNFYAKAGIEISGENIALLEDSNTFVLGDIVINSSGITALSGQLTALGELQAGAGTNLVGTDGVLYAGGDVSLTANRTLSLSGITVIGEDVYVRGNKVLELDGSYFSATSSADIAGHHVILGAVNGFGGEAEAKIRTIGGHLTVNGVYDTGTLEILGLKNLTVNADGLVYGEDGLHIKVGNLINRGQIISGADLYLRATNKFTSSGLIQAGGDARLIAKNMVLGAGKSNAPGAVIADNLYLTVYRNLDNKGLLQAAQDVSFNVRSRFRNWSDVLAGGDIRLARGKHRTGSYYGYGNSRIIGQNVDLLLQGHFRNYGLIHGTDIDVYSHGHLLNYGTIQADFVRDDEGNVLFSEDGTALGGSVGLRARRDVKSWGAVISSWSVDLEGNRVYIGATSTKNALKGLVQGQVVNIEANSLISQAGYVEGSQYLSLQSGGRNISWDSDGDGQLDRTWATIPANQLPGGQIVLGKRSTTLGSSIDLTAGRIRQWGTTVLRAGEGGLSITLKSFGSGGEVTAASVLNAFGGRASLRSNYDANGNALKYVRQSNVDYGDRLSFTVLSGDIVQQDVIEHAGDLVFSAANGSVYSQAAITTGGNISLFASENVYTGDYQNASGTWITGGDLIAGGSIQINAGGLFQNIGANIEAVGFTQEDGTIMGGYVSIIAAEMVNKARQVAVAPKSLNAAEMVITTADYMARQAWLDEQLELAKADGLDYVILQDGGTVDVDYIDGEWAQAQIDSGDGFDQSTLYDDGYTQIYDHYYYNGDIFCLLSSTARSDGSLNCTETRQAILMTNQAVRSMPTLMPILKRGR